MGEALQAISGGRDKAAGRIRLLLPRLAVSSVLAPRLGKLSREYCRGDCHRLRDLLRHRCINFRHGSAGLYRWEFEKGKKSVSVAVSGTLVVDDLELVIRGAVEGAGLAYVAEQEVAGYLADGMLVRVLEDWCQPYPGFFISIRADVRRRPRFRLWSALCGAVFSRGLAGAKVITS